MKAYQSIRAQKCELLGAVTCTEEGGQIDFPRRDVTSGGTAGVYARHSVFPFTDRQCRNPCKFCHREAICNGPTTCSTCGEGYRSSNELQECCKVEPLKCVNCSNAHAATSPLCPKRLKEEGVLNLGRFNDVDHRDARSAIN